MVIAKKAESQSKWLEGYTEGWGQRGRSVALEKKHVCYSSFLIVFRQGSSMVCLTTQRSFSYHFPGPFSLVTLAWLFLKYVKLFPAFGSSEERNKTTIPLHYDVTLLLLYLGFCLKPSLWIFYLRELHSQPYQHVSSPILRLLTSFFLFFFRAFIAT